MDIGNDWGKNSCIIY